MPYFLVTGAGLLVTKTPTDRFLGLGQKQASFFVIQRDSVKSFSCHTTMVYYESERIYTYVYMNIYIQGTLEMKRWQLPTSSATHCAQCIC